ncbi:MAG: LPS-assembly protein LptD [Alphaproteobacteria bacterium]
MSMPGGRMWFAGAAIAAALVLCSHPADAQPKKANGLTSTGVPAGNFLLQADEAIYNTRTGVVTARGHVEIANEDRVLLADSISFDQNTGVVTAEGHVSLTDSDGNVAFGSKVTLTEDMAEGVVQGFAALIGPNGRFVATSAERRQGRYIIANRGVFTPCKVCASNPTPTWQVRAYRVVHDNVKKEIRYEDATLDFLGVPVLYTPYFAHADPSVRHRTGFLLPDFGTSTFLGTFSEIPYYVALSDSQDFTVAPMFTTSAGTVLKGEYRERWQNGGMWLQGSAAYNPNASDVSGQWQSHLFGSGRLQLDPIWRTGYDVELTSNDTYLRRYDISDRDRLTTDLFVEGIVGRSRAAITGYFFQGLRPTDIAGQIPIVLPLVEYTYIPEHKWLGGQFRFDANLLSIFRTEGEDDQRASAAATWRLPFVTDDGQLITFQAFGRADLYHTSDALLTDPDAEENSQTIFRGLTLALLEWRWPFVSTNTPDNTSYVLEPIIQFIAAPYGGNPKGIPDEDSASFEFNTTNLFSINKFPGIDRWEDGPRANAGVRWSWLFPSGTLQLMLGEEFRLKANRRFAPDSGLGGTHSDIVGRIKVDFAPYLDLTHQLRIDQKTGSILSNQLDVRAKWGRSFLDLTYLRLPEDNLGVSTPEPRQEINLATSLNIYESWFLFASAIRDLEEDEMRDARLGITYLDECFQFSVGFRRKFVQDRDLRPASSIIFRIGLLTSPVERADLP